MVDIGFDIVFNNTELEGKDLQFGVKAVVEKGYKCLSQIGEKYYDKYEVGMKVVKFIKDDNEILVEVYMKLSGVKLEVIFLKSFNCL